MTSSKGKVESLHMTYAAWLRRIPETPEWLYRAFGVRTYLRPQVSFVVVALGVPCRTATAPESAH
jgi:hypothetical protein